MSGGMIGWWWFWHDVATVATPFLYGALGACVFLLRSLHEHIYKRTFDRRRKPEYFNRILLGTISGGVAVVLINQGEVSGDVSKVVGSSAIGFVAGYNTDLLFSAIERISNAVFPKPANPPAP